MQEWNVVKNQTDIEELLFLFGGFHDSCLRDVYISTQEFVDDRRAMHFDKIRTASLLFQRQFKTNPVLELKFEDLVGLNYIPLPEQYNNVILDVTLKMENGYFYWADFKEWEIGDHDAVWVGGKKLLWRFRPELIGDVRRLNPD